MGSLGVKGVLESHCGCEIRSTGKAVKCEESGAKTRGPTPLQESRDSTEDCNWGHLDLNSEVLYIFSLMCMGILLVCLSV